MRFLGNQNKTPFSFLIVLQFGAERNSNTFFFRNKSVENYCRRNRVRRGTEKTLFFWSCTVAAPTAALTFFLTHFPSPPDVFFPGFACPAYLSFPLPKKGVKTALHDLCWLPPPPPSRERKGGYSLSLEAKNCLKYRGKQCRGGFPFFLGQQQRRRRRHRQMFICPPFHLLLQAIS